MPILRNILPAAVLGILVAAPAMAAEIVQAPGTNYLAFQAEAADTVLNPDAVNDIQNSTPTGNPESPARTWTLVSDGAASGGLALEAPPPPHKQTSNTALQESIAVYPLRFATAGAYTTYLRCRNNGENGNGSSDSLWQSDALNEVNPSDNVSAGQTGSYEWRQPSGDLTVLAGQLGALLEYRIGVRESDARVDGVVLSLNDSLSDSELDALLVASPPGTNTFTNAFPCVANMTELDAAIAAALPGDTIYLCNGIWTDAEILFLADGLPGQPITLEAATPGQVKLEGESNLKIAGDYLVVKGLHFRNGTTPGGDVIQFRRTSSSDIANHSRLTECAMTDYNPADPATNYKWVSVYGQSNRVDHCHFSGMNHIGVTLTVWPEDGGPPNYTRIDQNYFGDRPEGTGNGFETIRIGTSDVSDQDSLATVESNLFYRCDGEIEIISNKTIGNLYQYNTFESCSGQLTLRHGGACTVQNNFFLGSGVSGSSGVRIIGPDHVVINNYFADLEGDGFRAAVAMMNGVPGSPLNRYLRVERALVAFNTFVNCEETFAIGEVSSEGDTTLPPIDCVIANNIVDSTRGPLIAYTSTPINMTYEGNLMWSASLGIPLPSGIALTDPQLSLATDGLMRPATNSPAINAAAGSYPTVLDDMDGDVRTLGTQDIGADEVGGGTPVYRPLTAADVGPRWMRPNLPQLVGLQVDSNTAHLAFRDLTGLAPLYRIEQSICLESNQWNEVATYAPNPATSSTFSVTSPVPTDPVGAWRVSVE